MAAAHYLRCRLWDADIDPTGWGGAWAWLEIDRDGDPVRQITVFDDGVRFRLSVGVRVTVGDGDGTSLRISERLRRQDIDAAEKVERWLFEREWGRGDDNDRLGGHWLQNRFASAATLAVNSLPDGMASPRFRQIYTDVMLAVLEGALERPGSPPLTQVQCDLLERVVRLRRAFLSGEEGSEDHSWEEINRASDELMDSLVGGSD